LVRRYDDDVKITRRSGGDPPSPRGVRFREQGWVCFRERPGFHLDEQHAAYHNVETIAAVEMHTLVGERERALAFEAQSPERKLMTKAVLVGRFE
jgi:hypothetical protein